MSTLGRDSYHHGDLRTELLDKAQLLLTDSPTFSLRALAKEAGVSPTATYRHFADKQALESALAARGYEDLLAALRSARGEVHSQGDLWRLAFAYVTWADANKPLFELMFTTSCDPTSPERVRAVAALKEFLAGEVVQWFPERADPGFLTGVWALVHGVATLYVQKKILTDDDATLEQRLEEIFRMFG